MSIHLTPTDRAAITAGDHAYLNQKGAKYYAAQDYASAIEYYHLAAAMGDIDSISNLGYCYMYARSIPKNMDLALAYFQAAGQRGCIDALYKLGSIYQYGADGIEPDSELSIYYYAQAKTAVDDSYNASPEDYPSLYLSLAKALMPGGQLAGDVRTAWEFLHIARRGFSLELQNGITYHQSALQTVQELLSSPCFAPLADEEDLC